MFVFYDMLNWHLELWTVFLLSWTQKYKFGITILTTCNDILLLKYTLIGSNKARYSPISIKNSKISKAKQSQQPQEAQLITINYPLSACIN